MATALLDGNTAIRMVNGRLVSPTLNDPEVKKEVAAKMGVLRQDLDALRAYYVRQGVITKGGNLTKRYGG
ncbi:MAG: hypothetical protein ACK4OE_16250 [Acidovorax sp.]|uniref:hypothetical protein n=1 Tax=Acidovorax sp. TaxID=1872122 RepID=UPI003919E8FE